MPLKKKTKVKLDEASRHAPAAQGQDQQSADTENIDTSLAGDKSMALDLLGELSGEVAHEINNPLFVMSGRLRQLIKLSDNGLLTDERLHSMTQSISEHVERLNHFTQSLLNFSRAMSTKTECQVGSLFDSLDLKLQPTFKAIGAQFSCSGDRGAAVGSTAPALLLVFEEVLRAMLAQQIAAAKTHTLSPDETQESCSICLHATQTEQNCSFLISMKSAQPHTQFMWFETSLGEPESFETNIARLCLKALRAEISTSLDKDRLTVRLTFPAAQVIDGSNREVRVMAGGNAPVKGAG